MKKSVLTEISQKSYTSEEIARNLGIAVQEVNSNISEFLSRGWAKEIRSKDGNFLMITSTGERALVSMN